jgi:hypothetical protein
MFAVLKQSVKYEVFFFDGTLTMAKVIVDRFNKNKDTTDENTSVEMFNMSRAYDIDNNLIPDEYEIEPYFTNDYRIIHIPVSKNTVFLFQGSGYITCSLQEFHEKYNIVEG